MTIRRRGLELGKRPLAIVFIDPPISRNALPRPAMTE